MSTPCSAPPTNTNTWLIEHDATACRQQRKLLGATGKRSDPAAANRRGVVRDDASVEHILAADDPTALATWLDRRLREEEGPLCAVDVMRASLDRIGPEMPVPELARRMAAHRLDAAGVTDDERRLLGIVTADDLFTLGMPDFFKQLKSVAFIAEFDPFEKYFQHEASLTARDVMRPTPATVGPDATILEVVFLLAVQGHPKVFVVDAQRRLLGVIDRIRVLDRILNL